MSFRWINQNGWFWIVLSYCSNILCNETEFIFVTVQNMVLPTSLMLAAIWVSLPTVSTWGQSFPLLWRVLSSSRHDMAAAVLIKAGVVTHRRPHRMGLWTLPDEVGESGQKLPRDWSYSLAPSPKRMLFFLVSHPPEVPGYIQGGRLNDRGICLHSSHKLSLMLGGGAFQWHWPRHPCFCNPSMVHQDGL